MASGTGGYNAAAYGDNGWNDGALITESGIAADLVLGSETPKANADVTEGTTPELGLNVSLSSIPDITGTSLVTPTGQNGTLVTGTVKFWTVIDTTSDGTETWTTGHAN